MVFCSTKGGGRSATRVLGARLEEWSSLTQKERARRLITIVVCLTKNALRKRKVAKACREILRFRKSSWFHNTHSNAGLSVVRSQLATRTQKASKQKQCWGMATVIQGAPAPLKSHAIINGLIRSSFELRGMDGAWVEGLIGQTPKQQEDSIIELGQVTGSRSHLIQL